MKLSDFKVSNHSPKKAPLTFNLNNEKQENIAATKIKLLGEEVISLKKELHPLRPLPARITALEEQAIHKEQLIANLEQVREQEQLLLGHAEEKVTLFTQHEEEIKRLKAIKEVLTAEKINLERDLIKSSEEISNVKREYNIFREDLVQKVVDNRALNIELEAVQTKFSTIDEEYSKLKSLYSNLSKINIEDKKELRILKTEYDYLIVDNNAAREKIGMLENVKNKLEGWASSLTRTNTDSTSKLAAFEQTVQNSKDVMIDMSEQIQHLMEEREIAITRIQYLTYELMKPKVFNETSMLRAARLPTGAEAVHRQYIGHGKPTMLKFKVKEEEENVLTV